MYKLNSRLTTYLKNLVCFLLLFLAGTVHDIVNRGGRCLIPVFALGRAQELLLILGRQLYSDKCLEKISFASTQSCCRQRTHPQRH